jgi:hypothetical protein
MDKQHAHQLLDQLDPGQLSAIGHLLEVMLDPVSRTLPAAPADDEPVTDQDRRRFRDGKAWFARRGGKGIPMDEVLAGFGVTPEDFR